MAGRGLPAMTGPAGHGRGQDAAGGAVVGEEATGVVEGAEFAGGGLVALEGDLGQDRARHSTGPGWR